jgi:hypothetical protein
MQLGRCLMALLVLGGASPAAARPPRHAARQLAEAPAVADRQRVVVSEGEGKTARLVNELEQELKASSYVVVRVPQVALEPEAMLKALREAHATRGILLAEDGKSVVVLAAAPDGSRMRVYGEYSLDRDNRLARRRQWIALVERLRVPTDEEDDDQEDAAWIDGIGPRPRPAASVSDRAAPPGAAAEPPSAAGFAQRLGLAFALGNVTGRTGFTSHLLLMGYQRLIPHLSLVLHVLWPMVPGESGWANGVHSRVWTFAGAVGFVGELGPPGRWVDPYLGATLGVQFLLAYVDWAQQSATDTYRVASLNVDAHAGVRLRLRTGTWLLVQVSGGRVSSLATRAGEMTQSLAEGWAVRCAVGLLMAL